MLAEWLAAGAGTEVHYLAPEAVDWMCRYAESVIYPSRDATRRPKGGERRSRRRNTARADAYPARGLGDHGRLDFDAVLSDHM